MHRTCASRLKLARPADNRTMLRGNTIRAVATMRTNTSGSIFSRPASGSGGAVVIKGGAGLGITAVSEGVEIEAYWRPIRHLDLTLTYGLDHTRIQSTCTNVGGVATGACYVDALDLSPEGRARVHEHNARRVYPRLRVPT